MENAASGWPHGEVTVARSGPGGRAPGRPQRFRPGNPGDAFRPISERRSGTSGCERSRLFLMASPGTWAASTIVVHRLSGGRRPRAPRHQRRTSSARRRARFLIVDAVESGGRSTIDGAGGRARKKAPHPASGADAAAHARRAWRGNRPPGRPPSVSHAMVSATASPPPAHPWSRATSIRSGLRRDAAMWRSTATLKWL
jgi:hypothetical protein